MKAFDRRSVLVGFATTGAVAISMLPGTASIAADPVYKKVEDLKAAGKVAGRAPDKGLPATPCRAAISRCWRKPFSATINV